MATGNPVCPFSSVGKIFKHLFLPVVKHFYQSEFGYFLVFFSLRSSGLPQKQKLWVKVLSNSLMHQDYCWNPIGTSEMQ